MARATLSRRLHRFCPALAVVPAASNSLAAAFPISLPTFITLLVALRAAALAALAALISDCSCRLTTSAATSRFFL